MTPIEKSKELIAIYAGNIGTYQNDLVRSLAITCATIAVDEVIEAIDWHEFETPNEQIEYWQQVKAELLNQ